MSIFERKGPVVDFNSDDDSDTSGAKVNILGFCRSKDAKQKKRKRVKDTYSAKKLKHQSATPLQHDSINLLDDSDGDCDIADTAAPANGCIQDEVKKRLEQMRSICSKTFDDTDRPATVAEDEIGREAMELERRVKLQREQLNAAKKESTSTIATFQQSSQIVQALPRVKSARERQMQMVNTPNMARLAAYANSARAGSSSRSNQLGGNNTRDNMDSSHSQAVSNVVDLVDSDNDHDPATATSSSGRVASKEETCPMVKLRTRVASGASAHAAHEWKWKIPVTESIGKMRKKFASVYGVTLKEFTFSFDGDVIGDEDTPEDLDMEDDNIIDVKMKPERYERAVACANASKKDS